MPRHLYSRTPSAPLSLLFSLIRSESGILLKTAMMKMTAVMTRATAQPIAKTDTVRKMMIAVNVVLKGLRGLSQEDDTRALFPGRRLCSAGFFHIPADHLPI